MSLLGRISMISGLDVVKPITVTPRENKRLAASIVHSVHPIAHLGLLTRAVYILYRFENFPSDPGDLLTELAVH